MDLQRTQAVEFSSAMKFGSGSDDELFGGSTTAESTTNCAEFTELSGSEDANVANCGMAMMPVMAMPMLSPTMAMPFQTMTQGAMQVPVSMAPQGQMMYCMVQGPDGTQMLMPVSTAQMPTWGMQMQPVLNQVPQNQYMPEFAAPANAKSCAGSLEARAAALSAYAAEVKQEARKAKQAAAAAVRRGRVISECTNKSEQAQSSETEHSTREHLTRWADVDMADQSLQFDGDDNDQIPNDDRTTLMFRNLPNNYNRFTLLHMLDSEGFKGSYSLVYLPTDFRNFAGFGYAFVNFVSHEEARRAKTSFQGFARWRVPSRKICDVVWSGPVQGLQAHTERYRNSPVMHDSVPDEYKPAVFVEGMRVSFPTPTKRIRPPRVRRNSAGEGAGIAAPVPEMGHSKRSGRNK